MTKPLDGVTVVIPLHDATDALGKILPGWRLVLQKTGRAFEILVVDDGTPDAGAVQRVATREPNTRVLRHETRLGYGACLRTALAEAKHPLFFYTAVDYPYVPSDLRKLLDRIDLKDEILGKSPDLISGCRTGLPTPALPRWSARAWALFWRAFAGMPIPDPAPWHGWPAFWHKTRAHWVYGIPLVDVNSCFKLFRTAFLRRFPIQSDGDFVHTELVAKATFLTSIMDEVPLTPKPDPVPSMGDIAADNRRVFGDPEFRHPEPAVADAPGSPVATPVAGAPGLPVVDAPVAGEYSQSARNSETIRVGGCPRRRAQAQASGRSRSRLAFRCARFKFLTMTPARPRLLFVTGKLAEPALRRMLADLAPKVGFEPEVAVLNITVAALLTANWVARHLSAPVAAERVILPGLCRGDVAEVTRAAGVPAELGPKDLRDLPEYFGKSSDPPPGYGKFDIEILAEINSAAKKSPAAILAEARHYRDSGADVIDLGCDPGGPWAGVADAVRMLRADGLRVSIDSFDPVEVEAALAAGAELVLSVNSTNVGRARGWHERFPAAEVVAIPDTPSDLDSLARTVDALHAIGIKHRLDPILEPIGFGFAASLGRYIEARRRFPDAELMMGIGNLTELTDADSAGLNVVLASFCQELGVRSVLTTEVINWARSCVKEFDLARRLVYHAIREKVLPKRLEPGLVLLRDPKLYEQGEDALREIAARVTDRNYRVFAERGEIHVFNGSVYLRGTDPFALFEQLAASDPKIDPSHAFYLGYEFAKAVTALTLGKNYTQDQALRWGFLTVPEVSHRGPAGAAE